MDFVSHALWAGAAVGRQNLKMFLWALFFSVLPDVAGEGVMFGLLLAGVEGIPGFEHGHPNITEFPAYAQNFYNATHSLLIFAAVFLAGYLIRKKPFWPLAAWGIHILIDIPTHSMQLFPTPFLWPVSDFKFDGVGWDNPWILIPNYVVLVTLYGIWLYKRRTKHRPA